MTTALAPVHAEDLWQIVAEVWESLLELPALRVDQTLQLDGALTASVAVHGEWTGLVTVSLPPATAKAVASAMLDLGPETEPTQDDVEDAIGEVVNVVGGNVKALLEGSSSLGLPRVRADWMPADALPVCLTGVEWPGHAARIAVWSVAEGGTDAESRKDAR